MSMFDSNWDLINGQDAHGIEVLNQSSVVNLIEALVRYHQHHDPTPGHACAIPLGQWVLQEIHRTGTLLLLQHPGTFRIADVQVRRHDGQMFYPPGHGFVRRFMGEFESDLATRWPTSSAVQIAAFALWRINWIHPFKNGNGRSARAFAYACVCLKTGAMLSGAVTMIDLITQSRDDYEAALAVADDSFEKSGVADLGALEAYVDSLLRKQMLSAYADPADPSAV